MVYSGYLLPKSNSSSTIKSEQNSSNLNNTNTTNATNNVSNHLKHNKKLSSIGSTSNRSSESSRFNETNSNVTIKSDLNKFNKNPKLAPEILFLIKEHAKTLETINQISKKLQEIEIKVDDISQRLSSRENSLNDNNFNKNSNNKNRTDQQIQKNNQLNDSQSHQKELNQTRLPYSSNYKDIDHLSNNLSNNATNIPNNQILSDDSGGEYGNKTTTKTVSDDDELLSILDKITKCSHHILQTQQAYQQQGTAIYNSLSKPYAYNNGLISNSQFNNNNTNSQLNHAGHLQQQQLNTSNNLQNGRQDFYNTQNLYQTNPYLNAKIHQPQIKPTAIIANQQHQPNNISQQQQQTIIPLKYSNQQQASLNELLFEPNVERFLSNLDQLVCNDDTANLAAILGTNQQTNTHLINSNNLPIAILPNQPQFIQVSPHQTSTPISNQPMPILQTSNNLRNYNLNNILQTSINQQQQQQQQFLNNNNNNISLHNTSPNNLQNQQQYLNWQRAKELLEKKEKERIDNQIKEADEWLTTVDHCINRNKYQSSKNKQLNNTKERDKK